jgi:hypothetical protein
MTMRTRLSARSALLAAAAACAGALASASGGCQRPILNPDEPRSQFDRYDTLRDQRAQTYIEDEFGFRRANVRGRLLGAE